MIIRYRHDGIDLNADSPCQISGDRRMRINSTSRKPLPSLEFNREVDSEWTQALVDCVVNADNLSNSMTKLVFEHQLPGDAREFNILIRDCLQREEQALARTILEKLNPRGLFLFEDASLSLLAAVLPENSSIAFLDVDEVSFSTLEFSHLDLISDKLQNLKELELTIRWSNDEADLRKLNYLLKAVGIRLEAFTLVRSGKCVIENEPLSSRKMIIDLLSSAPRLTFVSIEHVHLNCAKQDGFAHALLNSKSLVDLEIKNCRVDAELARDMANALKANSSLQRLCLAGLSKRVSAKILEGLLDHTSIRALAFEGCPLDFQSSSAARVIALLRKEKIQELSLMGCLMDRDASSSVLNALAENSSVKALKFLSYAEPAVLESLLSTNSALNYLLLPGVGKFADALVRGMRRNFSILRLDFMHPAQNDAEKQALENIEELIYRNVHREKTIAFTRGGMSFLMNSVHGQIVPHELAEYTAGLAYDQEHRMAWNVGFVNREALRRSKGALDEWETGRATSPRWWEYSPV